MKFLKAFLILLILISATVSSMSSLAYEKGPTGGLRSKSELNMNFESMKTACHIYRLLTDGFNKLIRKVKNILDLNFIEERIVNLVKVNSPKQATKEIENVKGNNINGKEIKDVKTDIVKKRLADRDTSKNAYKLRNIVLSSSLSQDEYNENYRKKRKRNEILALSDHQKNIFENETSNINTTDNSNKGRSNKNRESTFTQEEAKNVKEIETIYVPKTIAERSINSIIGKRNVKYMGFDYPIEVSKYNLIPTTEERVIQQAEYERKVNKLLSSDDAPIQIVTKKVIQPLSESNRSEQILDREEGSIPKPIEHSPVYHGDGSTEHEYAPGEVIIKIREKRELKDSNNLVLEKYSLRKEKHTVILNRLESRYDLKDASPIFKVLHKKLEESEERNKSLNELKEENRVRFPKRAKRIPKVTKNIDLLPIYILKTDEENIPSLCEKLNNDPDIEYAEPNYIVKTCIEPNDPLFEKQWSLNNTDRSYYPIPGGREQRGTNDCDIDAPEAWDEQTGTDAVIVAVIDTGVDYNHPDLQGNMWINKDEVPGNGIDDDGNGYEDDVIGWDFVGKYYWDPQPDNDPMDDHGHGTHCSGTIAAVGNNGIGISGVGWKAKIMAVKFLDSYGSNYIDVACGAINYAILNGADVLSNSWGGGEYSQTMQDVIDNAYDEGVIVVAAAGNSNSSCVFYPAGYEHVIAVAATDSNDEKAWFSNYGDWIDISAPGVDILSLRADNTDMYESPGYNPGDNFIPYGDEDAEYYIASGTSMACPHVAGGAALLISNEMGFSYEMIIGQLLSTADDIGNPDMGTGRLNIHRALVGDPEPNIVIYEYSVSNLYIGSDANLVISLKNYWEEASDVIATLTTDDPYINIIDGSCSYGDISCGEIKSNLTDPFVFHVDNSCPLEHKIDFTLEILANGGSYETTKVFCLDEIPRDQLPYIVSPSTNLTRDPLTNYNAKIVYHNNQVYVLWATYNGSTSAALYFSYYDITDKTWSPPVKLNRVNSYMASNADLIAFQDKIYIIWTEAPLGSIATNGYMAIYDPDNLDLQITSIFTGEKIRITSVSSDSNKIYSVWINAAGPKPYLKIYDPNSGLWTTIIFPDFSHDLPVGIDNTNFSSMIIDSDKIHICFDAAAGLDCDICYAYYDITAGAWGTPFVERINDAFSDGRLRCGPNLVKVENKIICVWSDGRLGTFNPNLFYSTLDLSSYNPNWSINKLAEIDKQYARGGEGLVSNGLDSAYIVYSGSPSGTANCYIYFTIYKDDNGFSKYCSLKVDDNAEMSYPQHPEVAMMDENKFFVVWEDERTGNEDIYFSEISKNPLNEPPEITSYSPAELNLSIDEGSSIDFSVTAMDPEGDPLTYLWTLDGVGKGVAGDWRYNTDYESAGEREVKVAVSDGINEPVYVIWTVHVNDVPCEDKPDLAPKEITCNSEIFNPGDFVRFETGIQNIGTADSNVFNVKWYVNGELDMLNGYGSHRGIPAGTTDMDGNSGYNWIAPEKSGLYIIKFVVDTDNHIEEINEDNNEVTITVRVANKPPELNPIGDKTVDEGEELTFTVSAADPNGDPLFYSASNLPDGANFSDNGNGTGTFSWAPTYEQAGIYGGVHFEVSDGELTDYEDITVTVNNVNRPPVADAGQDQVLEEGTLVTLGGSGSYDPDGDELSYKWISPVDIKLSDPCAVKPTFIAPDVYGTQGYIFTLTVTDSYGAKSCSVTQVTVLNVEKAIYVYDEFPNFVPTVYDHPPTVWIFNETDEVVDDNVYCMKMAYTGGEWGGGCFLNAQDNWEGDGLKFSGCHSFKFRARADDNVIITIRIAEGEDLALSLTNEWTEYEFSLEGYDLANVRHIFGIGIPGPANTVYFDEIRFITERDDNPSDVCITGSIFDNSSRILVDEEEFQVKGVGYDVCNSQHYQQDFPMIYNAGGNTIRTWGQNQAVFSTLDALEQNDMKILTGFWLPRDERDFYTDEHELNKQAVRNQLRRFINTFKGHPAVLGWLVGNEVYYRLDKAGATPEEKDAFLKFLDELCSMVKILDPNHPVGYAGAGLMPLEGLARLVPGLDFYGSNMYGYLSGSWAEDYLGYNYDKPVIFTEFGSNGPWEEPFKNDYGMFNETYYDRDKAQWIADRWGIINDNYGLTFGGCVFAWADCYGEDGEGLLRWGIVDNERTSRRQFIDLAKVWDEDRVRYIYVDDDSLSAGDGSQARPFGTIREGIDAASDYKTVAVAEGTYNESIHLKPNIWLEGGWSNDFSKRDPYLFKSIIDAKGTGTVVCAADNTTIDGFYITGSGNADQDWYASGIWSQNKNVRISNNVLYGNNRGISCWNSSNNMVRNNILCNHQTDTIYCFSSNPAIVNNTIANNIDPMGRPTFGVFCHEVKEGARIVNNIIAYNEIGIGVINPLSVPYIGYNDVWGNSIMEYEGVEDLTGVEGNIHREPLFIDPSGVPYGDFHLGDGSPCIDRGAPWSDYHNEPQPNGGRINMGAYGNTEQAETSAYILKIKLEADYILECQWMESSDPAYGCINDVFGDPTWVVPRENAMAILGLIRAGEVLGDNSYLERAQLAADYLMGIQESDGAWCNQYDEYNNYTVDTAKSPTQTAEVMLAFYFLGYNEDRYNSMEKGARYLLECQDVDNKLGQDDGLVCGGKKKKPDDSYHTWRWTSDNSYAYQAFGAAYNWAIKYGDYDFAETCSIARDKILNGINTYLKDPNAAVWHQAIDEWGNPQASDPGWINYAPLMLDVPAVCNIQDAGTWIHDEFQQEDGSCIGYYQGAVRKYPGLTFQASLCWIDTGQLPYKNKGIEWAEDSGLWQLTEDENGIAGGWIDWIEISPEQGRTADWWERFIDTSAYSIFVWTGGFDFNIQEEDEQWLK